MSNISNEEINKFNQHDWWNKDGPFKTLHDINPTRFDFILEHSQLKNRQILDVGCGGGIISEGLALRGGIVTAIDMAPNAIEIATEHAYTNELEIKYLLTTAENFSEDNIEAFDVITCLEMLEHVPTPSSVINACAKMLKPNGALFLSTINRTFKSKSLALFAAENILRIVPKNTHNYDMLITPLELYEICEAADLTVKCIQGMNYNPFTRVSYLTHDVNMNYLFYAVKN